MLFEINKEDLNLLKQVIKPEMFVISKNGVSKVVSIDNHRILTTNDSDGDTYYKYDEIIPLLKGFEHIELIDLYTIADLITDRVSYGNYRPNYNFLPHFYEVTEESIDLKIQLYHNFDVIHCENLIQNTGKVYYYLISKQFDIYNLHTKGLAIIYPKYYGTV
jgi:hypothetical protein